MVAIEAKEIIQTMYKGNPTELQIKALKKAYESLDKQIPYKLVQKDEDTGICVCGIVTEIIDEPFYCKYCGQKLCK